MPDESAPAIPDKNTFLDLPHRMRAPALVGTFMQYWAAMEVGLDACIAKALGLTSNQSNILSPNISFIPKTNILKAAIKLTQSRVGFSPLITEPAEHFVDLVNEIAGATGVRNVFAHYLFAESELNDGVQFLVVQAKGELKFPEEEWPVQRFLDFFAKLERWDGELKKCEAWLQPDSQNALEFLHNLYLMGYGPTPEAPPAW